MLSIIERVRAPSATHNVTVWQDGSETLNYELYKVNGSRDKFASGKAGITVSSINFEHENEDDVKRVVEDFKRSILILEFI